MKHNLSRRSLLKGGVALTGASLMSFSQLFGVRSARAQEGDDVETMFNLAATAETLACTHYYAALSSGIIEFQDLDIIYLRAALDAELQHLEFLKANGAAALTEEFYFPENNFTDLTTFVSITEALETAFVGAYLAATRRAAELGSSLLAMTAAQVAAVEAQHLALIRVTGKRFPPNAVTLAEAKFFNVSDAVPVLQPFLEGGDGFLGPELYLGADAIRELVADGGVTPTLPATDPNAFSDAAST